MHYILKSLFVFIKEGIDVCGYVINRKYKGICAECGKEFESQRKGKYCSLHNSYTSYYKSKNMKKYRDIRRKPLVINCKECNKEFETYSAGTKYCPEHNIYSVWYQKRAYEKERELRKNAPYSHVCKTCGEIFQSLSPRSKYCLKHNARSKYYIGKRGEKLVMKRQADFFNKMPRKLRGSSAELLASTDLMKQGYEVFRSLSPFGTFDLIIFDADKNISFNIEVTLGTMRKNSEKPYFHRHRETMHLWDFLAVVLPDRTLYSADEQTFKPTIRECISNNEEPNKKK